MSEDNALVALLEVFADGEWAFSEDLLRACYEIQRQYQFDKDRAVPVEQMRRLIDAEVSAKGSQTGGHDAAS